MTTYTIDIYKTLKDKESYIDWFNDIKDNVTKVRIDQRLRRVEQGNLGDYKSIEEGLYEFRFFFDAGIRIYFAIKDKKIIVLFGGGNKNTQKKDIEIAKQHYKEFKEGKNA
jgi:putative addiction module killer protein